MRTTTFAGNKSSPENICKNCGWQLDMHAAYDDTCPMPDETLAHHWRERGWGGSNKLLVKK